MNTVSSGAKWGQKLQHTFQLRDGKPVLPEAQTLEEVQEHRTEVLLSGVAHNLKSQVAELSGFARYDQSWLDQDSRPNHIVYSAAAHDSAPTDWGAPAWPGDETMDLQMQTNEAGELVSMRAFGPSRMGKDNLDRSLVTDWTLQYSQRQGGLNL